MTELKPCPFCGGTPYMAKSYNEYDEGTYYHYKCRNCGAQSGEKYARDTCPIFYDTLRDDWNRRADLSPRREAGAVKPLVWVPDEPGSDGEWGNGICNYQIRKSDGQCYKWRRVESSTWVLCGTAGKQAARDDAQGDYEARMTPYLTLTPLDTPVGNTDPMTIAKYDDELRAEEDTGSLNNIIALKIREIDELVPDCWKQEGYHYLPVSKPEPTGSSMWVVKTANGRSLIITDGDKETMSAVCPTEQTGNPVADAARVDELKQHCSALLYWIAQGNFSSMPVPAIEDMHKCIKGAKAALSSLAQGGE